MKIAKLKNILNFTVGEWYILLEAWFILMKWDLLISFAKYDAWQNKINISPSSSEKKDKVITPLLSLKVKHIIKLSEISARFQIRKTNCLRRCLSQQQLLNKRGCKTQMCIGVRIEKSQLYAHAWLTMQGTIINDNKAEVSRYSELQSVSTKDILNSLK